MSNTIGSIPVAAVAARSASQLRKLASRVQELERDNQQLQAKVASYERADRIRDIASVMEDRGLNIELTFEEKVASLAACADLDRVEEAVKMASSGSLNLPSVTDDDSVPGHRVDSASGFAQFCLTGHSGN
jgi:hypothetical protein